ncbi:putative transmembrane transport protein [Emticicia oligotrophica DSM 17448]|uniref:Transmembrane transport protein n=1 Tax=Emticicia oligotrophica (strain DSM 17448 / CIP 109782 / MTCC 6937 / GPTSA100-15) TaxID=929562 RepID=A0ABN4AID9_EMTOG|nr:NRAMP family divalent metal transporter [Emticicia oligotrophica]AFK01702.1 putative transmembrane transport protein [Emticicia oligotrophica DSM 17448]
MKNKNALLGAAFLMATSAIGPGFLTQTTVFTQQLAASFGFVILLSILLDIGAQLNVWRVVSVSRKPAQDLANELFFGLGYLLAFLIVIGGLAFNIGNVAGAGLGFEVLFGIDVKLGAIISSGIAIGIFLSKEAGKLMDNFAKILGFLMILLILYVVFVSQPPIFEAIQRTIIPQKFDALATVTLVGGTVGGYITFAGVHRLMDAGISGEENLSEINRSATTGILVTAIVRYLLFLASLGVVVAGMTLNKDNPPASVFQLAAGEIGYKIFGVVIWCAAITSVVGAAYTSVSFLRTFHPSFEKFHRQIIIGFIVFSTIIFVLIGKPVKILVLVGTINGFILPIALAIMLVASRKTRIVGNYKHSIFLQIIGWLVVMIMTAMAVYGFFPK